jgi:sugar lactone lactonase YvrE
MDKALESYEELVKRDSSDEESAYKVGYIYFQKANYRKALDYLSLVSSSSNKYIESRRYMRIANLKLSEAAVSQKPVVKTPPKAPVKTPPKVAAPVKKELSKVVMKGFNGPTGIAKDSSGNLYVSNYIENSIIQISPDGKKKVLVKGNSINGPIGLAVDNYRNIYVANYLSNEIVKINAQGKIISVLKGISKPYYLYIDKSGMLYISEQGTNTVIRLKI